MKNILLFKTLILLLASLNIHAATYVFNTDDYLIKNIIKEANDLLPKSVTSNFKDNITIEVKNLNPNGVISLPVNCEAHIKLISSDRNKLSIDPILVDLVSGKINHKCNNLNSRKFALTIVIREISYMYDRQRKASDDYSFLAVTGWFKKGILKSLKNNNKNKNSYLTSNELNSPQDSFAINMQYFILDKNYRCARPNYYKYFSQKFDHIPFTGGKLCEPVNSVILENSLVEIDRSKIYQIHYLFAGQGGAYMSKWGHAMFRIVMCSPKREKIGPDCMKDKEHHLVLSYAADTDGVINQIAGLKGNYDSKMSVTNMSEITKKYNDLEDRNIFSYPLKMNRNEINSFIDKTIEVNWGYTGKYYFITNNCAVESLNHLKSVYINNKKFYKENILTPLALRDHLIDLNIIDKTPFENYENSIITGHYFESNIYKANQTLKNLKLNIKFDKILRYDSLTRFSLLNDAIYLNKSKNVNYSSLIRIENLIMENLKEKIDINLIKFKNNFEANPFKNINNEALEKLKKLYSLNYKLEKAVQPETNVANLSLPLNSELKSRFKEFDNKLAENKALIDEITKIKNEINEIISPRLMDELKMTKANIDYFTSEQLKVQNINISLTSLFDSIK